MKAIAGIILSFALLIFIILVFSVLNTIPEPEYSSSTDSPLIKQKIETFNAERDYSVSYFLNKKDLNFNNSEKRYLIDENMNISFSKGIDGKGKYLVLIIDKLSNKDCASKYDYTRKSDGIADEMVINNVLFKKPKGDEILNINNISTIKNVENICNIAYGDNSYYNKITLIKYLE